MAVINYFDGINKKTTYTFNGRICDHIKGIDWDNTVILRSGYRISADTRVDKDDIIFIRKLPAVGVTVLAVTSAVIIGAVAYGLKENEKNKQLAAMEKANKAAKAASDQANKLAFVKGTRNSTATGNTFPFAMGKSLMTPYWLCSPHYSISGDRGEKQYFNAVMQVAFNDVVINKIKMGETVIKDFGATTTPQNGQYAFDQGLYYDEDNLIEIRQTGAFTDNAFNEKIISTEINTEIPHRHAVDDPDENQRIEDEWQAGVVQELPTNTMSAELVVLFDGLQEYKDGAWSSEMIILQPQWTNVNNPQESDWVNFDFDRTAQIISPNVFIYNTKEQMRFKASIDFTAAQAYGKNMKIRIRRTSPKADGSAKDTVYLQYVQAKCYDAKKSSSSSLVAAEVLESDKRDECCRIGIRVAANNNTKGQLDAISVIQSACARTWNGSAWSQTKTPTSNLASWVLELLTSPHHVPSQYADAELDLDSFGALYEYCETMGFKADGVIANGVPKKNTINTLCGNANAALVYNPLTGLIEAAIDNGRDYSIALLNSENIISISTTKEFKRKTDGKKVKYINAAADYDIDTVTFMRDGGDYDPANDTLTETALQYVTSYAHAYKIAWRQMAEEMAQPRVVQIKAGLESAYYPLYSRVDVQHKSLKIGLANGVIKSLVWQNSYLKKIILEGSVTFPLNIACGVIINCVSDNGHGIIALKVTGTGKTSELNVTTTLRNNAALIPSVGNILSFGELDNEGEFTTITTQMKITDAEESDGGYMLTLVDYNPAVYQYGTLPTYKSNLTSRPNGKAVSIEEQRPYITQGDAEANASEAAQAAVDIVTTGHRFTNVYKLRNDGECLEEIIKKIDDDARNASASISISEDEILLQVENTAKGLRGLIDIQAGSVQALVEGGGATGQMSLTLNLPVMIDADKRADLIAASSEAKVNAVYGLVENTDYYAIKGNASDAAVKALWDDAVDGGLIASQIDLSATQIKLNGDNIYVNGETMFTGSVGAEKIKAALLDVDALFAQNITVANSGSIKSSDYSEDIRGWKLSKDGIEANNGYFRGILGSTENYGNTWNDYLNIWNGGGLLFIYENYDDGNTFYNSTLLYAGIIMGYSYLTIQSGYTNKHLKQELTQLYKRSGFSITYVEESRPWILGTEYYYGYKVSYTGSTNKRLWTTLFRGF